MSPQKWKPLLVAALSSSPTAFHERSLYKGKPSRRYSILIGARIEVKSVLNWRKRRVVELIRASGRSLATELGRKNSTGYRGARPRGTQKKAD